MGTLRLLLALTVLNWHYPIVPFNFIFSYSAVLIFHHQRLLHVDGDNREIRNQPQRHAVVL